VRVAAPLLPIFRSRLQGELLALVLVDPARSWTIDELSQRTAQPYQTVATEVRRLHDSGLFTMTAVGRAKLLSANESKPYVRPLTQLVLMAFGPPLVIGEELAKVVGSSSCSSTAWGGALLRRAGVDTQRHRRARAQRHVDLAPESTLRPLRLCARQHHRFCHGTSFEISVPGLECDRWTERSGATSSSIERRAARSQWGDLLGGLIGRTVAPTPSACLTGLLRPSDQFARAVGGRGEGRRA
jgi:hypothetical protein